MWWQIGTLCVGVVDVVCVVQTKIFQNSFDKREPVSSIIILAD